MATPVKDDTMPTPVKDDTVMHLYVWCLLSLVMEEKHKEVSKKDVDSMSFDKLSTLFYDILRKGIKWYEQDVGREFQFECKLTVNSSHNGMAVHLVRPEDGQVWVAWSFDYDRQVWDEESTPLTDARVVIKNLLFDEMSQNRIDWIKKGTKFRYLHSEKSGSPPMIQIYYPYEWFECK